MLVRLKDSSLKNPKIRANIIMKNTKTVDPNFNLCNLINGLCPQNFNLPVLILYLQLKAMVLIKKNHLYGEVVVGFTFC